MKNNLNFYYKDKQAGIIATMVLTTIFVIWELLYNFFDFIREHDIIYSFNERENMDPYILPFAVFISLVEIFLPLSAMILNLRTVNFRKYLKNLLMGCGLVEYFTQASIFVR